MPRNAAGVYTLPAGNPVVPATTITSVWGNATMSDIGSEMTNSLDRAGRGGMTAALKGVAGTLGVPAFSWTAEPSTGLWNSAAGEISVSALGVLAGKFSSLGWTGAVVGHSSLDLPLTGGTLSGLLTLSMAANIQSIFEGTSQGAITLRKAATGGFSWYTTGAGTFKLFDNDAPADRLFVVPSGWLGVGVSPASGWATGTVFRGMELGPDATSGAGFSIYGQSSTAAGYLATGIYFDGTNYRYKGSVYGATNLRLFNEGSNGFIFQVAPIGVAGNIATLTTVLSLTAAGVIQDGAGNELGYKGLPANTQAASYAIVQADNGKKIIETFGAGAAVVTATGLSADFTTTIVNASAGAITISQAASTTIRMAGTTTTGSRTLAAWGIATLAHIGSNVFLLSGAGVT